MERSNDRILTTHVGSLPRPPLLAKYIHQRLIGSGPEQAIFENMVTDSVFDSVKAQTEQGLDIVTDGEMGKTGFIPYINERIDGFEPAGINRSDGGSYWASSREAKAFPGYYEWASKLPGAAGNVGTTQWVCSRPISYKGHAAVEKDIANLQKAASHFPHKELFMPAISPANVEDWEINEYYSSDEEFLYAIAEVLREEYKIIVDSGVILQLDDPLLATYYVLHPECGIAECRRWAETRVEALNYALRGIPEDRIRYHTCYSINMGPRVHEMEMRDIVDIMLRVNAGAYSFEAGNPRHEHEWRIWEDIDLPAGKSLIPGVITNSSVLVEHPELVAERIVRFSEMVGKENIIAGADCGFASFATSFEVHPEVVWAKMRSLVVGARQASDHLW